MLRTLTQKVNPEHCALLLVDVQNDFCAVGGAMHAEGRDISMAQAMVPRLSRLLDAARAARVNVVWMEVATIPANPGYTSLNLAAAVQVAAYELRVAAGRGAVWAAPRFPPASHDEIEGLHAHAVRTLALRFLDPAMPKRLMPRLRRLFARAGLEREEVNILRGLLKALLKK